MASLELRLSEYYNLKKQMKLLEERTAALNKSIKEELSKRGIDTYTSEYTQLVAKIQHKERFNFDPGKAVYILMFKDPEYWTTYTTTTTTPALIESAYLDGVLDDSDLRELRESTEQTALTVEMHNVQS